MKLTIKLLLFIFPFSLSHGAVFTRLGDISGGDYLSRAMAISPDGSIVVGETETANGTQAFRWTIADGMQLLTNPDQSLPYQVKATAVDNNGTIAGCGRWAEPSLNNPQAFLWNPTDGFTFLGDLYGTDPLATSCNMTLTRSHTVSLSYDGQVLAARSNSPLWPTITTEAVRYTPELGMQGLGALAGDSTSYARAVSGDGQVIVGLSGNFSFPSIAFRWSEQDGMQSLGDLPGGIDKSEALAVSADGSVVAGGANTGECLNSTSCTRPFRWTAQDGMQAIDENIDVLGAYEGQANAISADGGIIVGDKLFPGGWHPFIWDAVNGMRDLQSLLQNEHGIELSGWILATATGVSADGTVIAGWGLNPDGNPEGFHVDLLATPVYVDLQLTGNVVEAMVNKDQPFNLQYQINNVGATDVATARWTLPLPSSVQLNSLVVDSGDCQNLNGVLSCDVTDIAGGTSNIVDVNVTAGIAGAVSFDAEVISLTGQEQTPLDNSVQLTVSVNDPPQANAGEDQTLRRNSWAQLSGDGSYDTDGTVAGFQWQQTAGPAVTHLSDTALSTISFRTPRVTVNTDVIFQLTVIDDLGAQGTDTVVITVTP